MPLIQEILNKSSVDFPNKEAVVCGDSRYSYAEIEIASSKLADFFSSHGMGHGTRIGIFTNKCINEIIAIFAILKAGGIFIHINPRFKEGHFSHVVEDCGIKALFVDKYKMPILKKAFTGRCPIDTIISLSSESYPDSNMKNETYFLEDILKNSSSGGIPGERIEENDIASIIYTSGSTGMPKGVIITHKIFYESTTTSAAVLENNHDDRLISVTPFSFDGALSQLFTSFLVGGTLIQQKSNFPKDIVDTLIKEKITGFHAMPSFWRMLIQKYSPFPKHEYPDLRYVSIIGEVFPEKQLCELREILKYSKFYMMYGTTEAFRSTYLPPEDIDGKKSSVGIPFPGVEISIVDEVGNQCKPGEIGEIIHKGAFVSPGYWGEKNITDKTFKENYIHTGDLGKLDRDGYLYFIGRKDNMIKVQGFRVSPSEIESCIYQMEGVKEVSVIGISDDEAGTGILAAVVLEAGYEISQKEVIFHCRERLPNYMVPKEVVFLESLPRTGTYKINSFELLNMINSRKSVK